MDKFAYFKKEIEPPFLLMATRMGEDDGMERRWVMAHVDDDRLHQLAQQLSTLNLHMLTMIARHDEINGVALAQALGVTKGAVTKAAKRLLQLKLVVTTKQPNNRKSVYYRLTVDGQAISRVHVALDDELDRQAQRLTATYSAADLQTIQQFLTDFLAIRTKLDGQ